MYFYELTIVSLSNKYEDTILCQKTIYTFSKENVKKREATEIKKKLKNLTRLLPFDHFFLIFFFFTIFRIIKGHNSFNPQTIFFKLSEPHCYVVLNIYTKFH